MAKIPRFYVSPRSIGKETIQLKDSVFGHAIRVLRLQDGDLVRLFDGTGREYKCRLTRGANGKFVAYINQELPVEPPLIPKLYLYQAFIKKERWEWLIEKGTELGVDTFIPLMTRYTEMDVTEKFEKKKERWETIIQSTCEQCNRNILSKIAPPLTFDEAIREPLGAPILCYEGEPKDFFKDQLANMAKSEVEAVSIFIGPVGGFSEEEIALAYSLKVPIVSLGQLTLRAETAGVAALAIVSFWLSMSSKKIQE